MVLVLPPKLSAAWFPPSERTTATAVASLANSLGAAVGFLLGPGLVTRCDVRSADSAADVEALRGGVRTLYLVQLLWAVATTALALAHFPERPPTPPSRSAAASERADQLAVVRRDDGVGAAEVGAGERDPRGVC